MANNEKHVQRNVGPTIEHIELAIAKIIVIT